MIYLVPCTNHCTTFRTALVLSKGNSSYFIAGIIFGHVLADTPCKYYYTLRIRDIRSNSSTRKRDVFGQWQCSVITNTVC